MRSRLEQDLFSGLVPLHILHHANEQPVYGMWIIEELAEHGYKLSAGTLYPLLHRIEKRGLLRSEAKRAGSRSRRVYRITPAGRRALAEAKHKVRELFGELFESDLRRVFGHHGQTRRRKTGEK
jgi:DNA-binding PadR family transcriptional regulator